MDYNNLDISGSRNLVSPKNFVFCHSLHHHLGSMMILISLLQEMRRNPEYPQLCYWLDYPHSLQKISLYQDELIDKELLFQWALLEVREVFQVSTWIFFYIVLPPVLVSFLHLSISTLQLISVLPVQIIQGIPWWLSLSRRHSVLPFLPVSSWLCNSHRISIFAHQMSLSLFLFF